VLPLQSMNDPLQSGEMVRHRPEMNRYEIGAGDQLAIAEYRREGKILFLTHTFVPPALRGRGLAERLVRGALDEARAQDLRVVPACSYVAAFIRRHAEYQDLVAQ